jgi:aspartate aminotransferase
MSPLRLSSRAEQCAPSPTLAITAKVNALCAAGEDIIGFGAGEPDFDTPEHIKDAAIAALQRGMTKYTPSAGIEPLRKAICEKLQRDHGLEYTPKQILVSCGAKHTLYNAFQALLEPGDEVIIPAPYWVSYPEQVKLAAGVPVFVQTSELKGFRLTADSVAGAITPRTRALVINSPSNPTGAVIAPDELRKIGELAVKHDLIIISDEIYEKLVYDGQQHVSIAQLSREVQDRTILVNGLSKAYSMTGWRVGYVAAEQNFVAAMGRIQDQSTSNITSFIQPAAVEALCGPQEAVEAMRRAFARRRRMMVDGLNAIRGISCVSPGGAFYCFANVSAYIGGRFKDADALCDFLLSEGKVALTPGTGFGSPDHVRLSYATSERCIEEGLARVRATLEPLAR